MIHRYECSAAVIVHILSCRFGIRDPSDFNENITIDEQQIADIIGERILQSSKVECEIDDDYYLYDRLDGD